MLDLVVIATMAGIAMATIGFLIVNLLAFAVLVVIKWKQRSRNRIINRLRQRIANREPLNFCWHPHPEQMETVFTRNYTGNGLILTTFAGIYFNKGSLLVLDDDTNMMMDIFDLHLQGDQRLRTTLMYDQQFNGYRECHLHMLQSDQRLTLWSMARRAIWGQFRLSQTGGVLMILDTSEAYSAFRLLQVGHLPVAGRPDLHISINGDLPVVQQ